MAALVARPECCALACQMTAAAELSTPEAPPPAPSQPSSAAYVSAAQSALSRGLAALVVLDASASEEQTAEALLRASFEIRTVAEQECATEEAPAPGDPPSPRSAWQLFRRSTSPEPVSTSSVLRLFEQLERSDEELAAIKAHVRRVSCVVKACSTHACSLTRIAPRLRRRTQPSLSSRR